VAVNLMSMEKTSFYIPDVIVIGSGKSATTSIYELFSKTSGLLCYPKEINFFSEDNSFRKGDSFLESKLNINNRNKDCLICDVSPQYSDRISFPETAGRIFNSNSDAKIIYIVRDPVSRMRSIWRHRLPKEDKNNYDFNEIILNSSHKHHQGYVDESKYFWQIEAYRKYFPDDRIFVIHFEDLIMEDSYVIRDLQDFIGIEFLTRTLPAHNWSRPVMTSKLVFVKKMISANPRIAQEIKKLIRPIFNFVLLRRIFQYHKDLPVVSKLALDKIDELVMTDYERICDFICVQDKRFQKSREPFAKLNNEFRPKRFAHL